MSKVSPEYIVIEGPIGVGKTTLAIRLADALGTDLMLEFKPSLVSDFLVQKDKLFAGITLSDQELDLYNQIYSRLALDEAPAPDLVIYLQANVDDLQRRVYERGNNYERNINEQYLKSVADAYIDFFYNYDQSPLLIVNTADFDLARNTGNFQMLLEYIQDLAPGRHYFNPKEL